VGGFEWGGRSVQHRGRGWVVSSDVAHRGRRRGRGWANSSDMARRGRRRGRGWAVIREVGEGGERAWSVRVIFAYSLGDLPVGVFRDCGGRKERSLKI